MDNIQHKDMFCRPTEERALLCYCMNDIASYFSVCAKLAPTDFLYSQHQLLVLLFEKMAVKGAEKFETSLIIAEAEAEGVLQSIGGIKYIKTIAAMAVSEVNFEVYLKIVVEAATKYKLYRLLEEKIALVRENAAEGLEGADLLGGVESSLLDLSMSGLNINEPINLSENISEYLEERRENKISLSGMSTGYPILDKQIDGMVNGTLLVIAARKKMGKSTFLTNIALNAAIRLNVPILYIDTELSFKEWRSRAIATISGVPERDIKHGGYDDVLWPKLQKVKKLIEGKKIFHEYMPGYSVDKIVSLYKKYHIKEKLGLIVFDYLKEPDSTSVDRQRKEYQILGDVTTKLKDLAGQLDIPALTAVQLNRDNDIADSDRIARYADVTAFWKERKGEELEEGGLASGNYKLIIKDTRRGGATSESGIGYRFKKECLQIREVPIDQQYFTNFEKAVNNNTYESDDEENQELF